MTKPIWGIRMEPWAIDLIIAFGKTHKLCNPETLEVNKTDSLHGILRDLSDKAKRTTTLEHDVETLKEYVALLEQKQNVYCKSMDSDVSQQRCYNCAVMKQRPLCPIGFNVRANKRTVKEAHEIDQTKSSEQQVKADGGNTDQTGVQNG